MDSSVVRSADLRLAELARREKVLQRELKRERERVRRSQAVCSPACWRVSVAIVCFCDGDVSASSEYASRHHQTYHDPTAFRAKLQEWWASSSAAQRQARSVAPEGRQFQIAAETARKFLTEKQLHSFVDKCNMDSGVAPVTSVVISEAHRIQGAGAEPAACLLRRTATKRSLHHRLRRWRLKFKVSMGRIVPRDSEPLGETQKKVGLCTPQSSCGS